MRFDGRAATVAGVMAPQEVVIEPAASRDREDSQVHYPRQHSETVAGHRAPASHEPREETRQ